MANHVPEIMLLMSVTPWIAALALAYLLFFTRKEKK